MSLFSEEKPGSTIYVVRADELRSVKSTENEPTYEGSSVVGRYMWWVTKEINHINPNIDAYAKLIVSEFARLEKNVITIEEFEKNTPNIEDETSLNYIQKQIIMHYPN